MTFDVGKELDKLGVKRSEPFNDDFEYVHTKTFTEILGISNVVSIPDSHYTPVVYAGILIQLSKYIHEIRGIVNNIVDDIEKEVLPVVTELHNDFVSDDSQDLYGLGMDGEIAYLTTSISIRDLKSIIKQDEG